MYFKSLRHYFDQLSGAGDVSDRSGYNERKITHGVCPSACCFTQTRASNTTFSRVKEQEIFRNTEMQASRSSRVRKQSERGRIMVVKEVLLDVSSCRFPDACGENG